MALIHANERQTLGFREEILLGPTSVPTCDKFPASHETTYLRSPRSVRGCHGHANRQPHEEQALQGRRARDKAFAQSHEVLMDRPNLTNRDVAK